MKKTIAEKILSAHAGKDVYAGDFAICAVDFTFGQDGTSSSIIGAKTFVGESGGILGSVTIGGCLDARAVEAADRVLATDRAEVLDIALEEWFPMETGRYTPDDVRGADEAFLASSIR